MKKPLIIIIIVIIVAGVGIYFATQGTKTENINQAEPATNSAGNTNNASAQENTYIGEDFTILQPADWTQGQIPGTLVSFHNTGEVQPEGSAAKKINFQSYLAISFDLANERSLAEINDLTINQIKATIPSAEVITTNDETIDGQPAKVDILTLSQQEVDYTVFMAVISKDDKYYAITGNTTTDKWAEYKDMFYATARSFTME
ncbi:MAG: PsbP-related protein [bacterium]